MTSALKGGVIHHAEALLGKATRDESQGLTGSLIVACYPEKTDART
jgi:hypothetical protein